jgi:uncharacterized protein YozE (UPF0346 family)
MSQASNRRSVALDQRAYEDPDTFRNGKQQYHLTEDEQEALLRWILANFTAAKTVWRRSTSCTIKHWFEASSGGFYVTNGHFKGAMLAAGFEPADPTAKDWLFRIRRVVHRPQRGSFLAWLLRRRHRDDPIGDLARDASRDRGFPSGETTEAELRTHLVQFGACRDAQEALHEAWTAYERSRTRRSNPTGSATGSATGSGPVRTGSASGTAYPLSVRV